MVDKKNWLGPVIQALFVAVFEPLWLPTWDKRGV